MRRFSLKTRIVSPPRKMPPMALLDINWELLFTSGLPEFAILPGRLGKPVAAWPWVVSFSAALKPRAAFPVRTLGEGAEPLVKPEAAMLE